MPIIQRRSASATLPVTNKDVKAGPTGNGNHQTQRRPGLSVSPYYDRTSLIRWVIIAVISMAIASLMWKPILSLFGLRTQSAPQHNRQIMNPGASSLPLSQFSELTFALQNSDLVALYFAAHWCPMSTPISLALDKAFGKNDMILTPEGGRKTLSIVYVSSDKTEDEYNGYLHSRNWLAIPFESPQRNKLKRHFYTCAHRELEELGFDRKHEIPTIIVIDSQTQGIITTNGADDVDEMGERSLGHWKDAQQWIRKTKADIDNLPPI